MAFWHLHIPIQCLMKKQHETMEAIDTWYGMACMVEQVRILRHIQM